MPCPFLNQNRCSLAEELADSSPIYTTPGTCKACSTSNRPNRVNLITITLSGKDYDISKLGKGYGTQLSNLLYPFFQKLPGCRCKGHKDLLDLWTPEYIRKNIDRVVNWLAEEARKRKIPFSYKITRSLLLAILPK